MFEEGGCFSACFSMFFPKIFVKSLMQRCSGGCFSIYLLYVIKVILQDRIQSVEHLGNLFSSVGFPKFDRRFISILEGQVLQFQMKTKKRNEDKVYNLQFFFDFQAQFHKAVTAPSCSWQEFCIVCFSFHCCNFAILILAILEYRNPEVKKMNSDWYRLFECSSLRHKAATK